MLLSKETRTGIEMTSMSLVNQVVMQLNYYVNCSQGICGACQIHIQVSRC